MDPARRTSRRGSDRRTPLEGLVRHPAAEESPGGQSATAVAMEALRSGVLPGSPRRDEAIPHESETMRIGDPDDDVLSNAYVGEDTPGGSTPTPDQNGVDAIGRAYGLQEEDSGALRSAGEVLGRRDRRRSELRAPRRPHP
jgi:hypothetical protein